jgi:LysM repeat protein
MLMVGSVSDAQTLRGSHASVDLMYTSARSHDLAFLQAPRDVYEAARLGELKLLGITRDMTLQRVEFPFVLPNTKRFVDSLAAAYHAGCGERLVVTSGARPVALQPRNASPLSVHPTGMAVDFHKPAGKCLTWLRTNLMALEQRHVIEATEERHPPHFHVAVLNQAPERPITQLASATVQRAPQVNSAEHEQTASGQVAGRVTGPSTYRVRAGDNLWTIAQRLNTTPKKLQTLNKLGTTRLRVGQRLKLP